MFISIGSPLLRCLLLSAEYGRGVDDDPLTAWQKRDLDIIRQLLKRLELDQERCETLVDEPVGVCLTLRLRTQSLGFTFCGLDPLFGLVLEELDLVLLGDGVLLCNHLVLNRFCVFRVEGQVVDTDLGNGDRITCVVQNLLHPSPHGLSKCLSVLSDYRAVVVCRLFLQNVGKLCYEQLAEVVRADVVQDVLDCFPVDLDVDGDIHVDVLVVVTECFHPTGAEMYT